MSTWSFYDPDTGLFTGEIFSGKERVFDINRRGRYAVRGRFDRRTHRVDIDTGSVVVFEAPPDKLRERDRTEARITRLEARQHRRVRELLSETDPTLKDIESQIAELRDKLR